MKEIRLKEPSGDSTDYFYCVQKGYIRTEQQSNDRYYTLIYMISGEARIDVKGEVCVLLEFDYMMLRRGEAWRFLQSEANTELIVIYMHESEMEKFYALYGERVKKYIETEQGINKISGDFNVKFKVHEIYGRLTKYGDVNRILCRLLTTEILTGLVRKMHRKLKSDEIPAEFVNALNEMRKYKNLREGVSALEGLTRYSRAQLCRLIKKYYNMTPQEYIAEIRLNFAYNMIKFSNMDYASIAETVGYSSISHFYKKFRDRYEITPAELRKNEGIQL